MVCEDPVGIFLEDSFPRRMEQNSLLLNYKKLALLLRNKLWAFKKNLKASVLKGWKSTGVGGEQHMQRP